VSQDRSSTIVGFLLQRDEPARDSDDCHIPLQFYETAERLELEAPRGRLKSENNPVGVGETIDRRRA
jgi:hypothetical protein